MGVLEKSVDLSLIARQGWNLETLAADHSIGLRGKHSAKWINIWHIWSSSVLCRSLMLMPEKMLGKGSYHVPQKGRLGISLPKYPIVSINDISTHEIKPQTTQKASRSIAQVMARPCTVFVYSVIHNLCLMCAYLSLHGILERFLCRPKVCQSHRCLHVQQKQQENVLHDIGACVFHAVLT